MVMKAIRTLGQLFLPEELTVSRFSIEMDGLLIATFKECSGLSATIAVETIQEGGLNGFEHKLPGRTSYGNVTLSGGVASGGDVWDWFEDVSQGNIKRKNISIVMYRQSQWEAMRWNLEAAYPVSWTGPTFTAGDANITVMSVELAHEGISKGL